VRQLERDRQVALIAPDAPVKAVTVPVATGENVPPGVSRIEAAVNGTAREPSGVAVAVLDTGIDLANPDLNAEPGVNCVGGRSSADDNGHGTHVSSVLAARNNGSGVVGVAPGTKLISVKVLDGRGEAHLSTILCGVDWITAHAASLRIKVANASLEGYGPASSCDNDPLHLAICKSTAAGVTYVAAAGNDGRSIGTSPIPFPASYPEVLTVSAMGDTDGQPGGRGVLPACADGIGEADDRYATFSNYAQSSAEAAHTVAAPGVCILGPTLSNGYDSLSGTSLAAPHVAGAVALCLDEGGRGGPCAGRRSDEIVRKIADDAARYATHANGFVGDPNSSVGPYYGYLVSVPESTKPLPAPQPSARSVTVDAPSDESVSFRLLRARSRHGRINLTVQMEEPGSVWASGSVKIRRTQRRFASAERTVSKARTVRLVLSLPQRSKRRLAQALRQGRRLRARVAVRAADRFGNSALQRRAVLVRR
jgi:subtilisin family serine protease